MADPPQVGDRIPEISLDVTLRRLVINVGSSWDFFPGHFDTGYARANGHSDVFANTSLFLGVADRAITDWAGPRARIARRKLTMIRPVHAGETMFADGVVTGCRQDDGRQLIDLEIEIRNEQGRCAHATATIELVHRPDAALKPEES
jgi:acyl dehydratase